METMDIRETLKSVLERLGSSATVKTVYGDPIESNGKTVIPVAKVAYGFGGGAGTKGSEEDKKGDTGTGGGGGILATPVGVVEIDQEETRFIAFHHKVKLFTYAGLGVVIGYFLGRMGR